MELRTLRGGATLQVLPDAISAARAAASFVISEMRQAIATRGRFAVAFSGGGTPLPMFEHLAQPELPWRRVQVFQVDERAVSFADPDRNAHQLRDVLVGPVALPEGNLHLIPVEQPDPASRYADTLKSVLGAPAVFDLVHLGLGDDGHTASLVPEDPALEVWDKDVAEVAQYRGHPRVSLTFPALNRARRVLWLVSGAGKRRALAELISGASLEPAGRVERARAHIIADEAAAGALEGA